MSALRPRSKAGLGEPQGPEQTPPPAPAAHCDTSGVSQASHHTQSSAHSTSPSMAPPPHRCTLLVLLLQAQPALGTGQTRGGIWAPGLCFCAGPLRLTPLAQAPCFRQFPHVLAVARACVARTEQLSRSSVTQSPAHLLPPNVGHSRQTRGLQSCLPAPASQDTGCFL